MDNLAFLYDISIDELTKYETVILASRRAREINEIRITLEKKHDTHLIEKEKPSVVAIREIIENKLAYEFHDEGEKPAEQPQRGMKKTI